MIDLRNVHSTFEQVEVARLRQRSSSSFNSQSSPHFFQTILSRRNRVFLVSRGRPMSLYTPIFPSLQDVGGSRETFPESSLGTVSGKQRSYVEFLRDIHLFLSSQSDMLSPPSRPNSPMFDHRVQKVKGAIQDIFHMTEDESPSGKWTRVSQALKLGCLRGRRWSVPEPDLRASEEDTNWILPDEESEWIEWEKKREEDRRLQTKTNVSHGNLASVAPDSQIPQDESFAKRSRPYEMARERRPPGVPPSVLRAAKDKVREWQASVASEVWHDTPSGMLPASRSLAAAATATNGRIRGPQRSRTLDFTVIKPTAKSVADKRAKNSLSQPTGGGGFSPAPSHKPKLPNSSKPSHDPAMTASNETEIAGLKQPLKTSSVTTDTPKITDVPETPYLAPSFPAHLKTSTPLPTSVAVIRSRPPPILPIFAASSTPPQPIPADPPDDRQLISVEPHATNVSSSQPPQMGQPTKRPRGASTSLGHIVDDPLLASPTKRLRTLPHDYSTPASEYPQSLPSNGDNPSSCAAPPHQRCANSPEMALGAPFALGKNNEPIVGSPAQDLGKNIPSPTKSVKSYFSAPDSDPADSPVKANLLLESPVSPMLSYAQNPGSFLPQITSTQMRKGSPTPSRKHSGVFGMGYSSQFDIERHVDRVSELLEKDVDFDGWLRDVRTMETGRD